MAGDARELPSLDAFLGRLGAEGAPASHPLGAHGSAGAVAALIAALSVDLAAQVALDSPEWEERGGALAQAAVIRERSVALAADVERLYGAALAGLARARGAPADASAPGAERLGAGEEKSGTGGEELGSALTDVVERLLAIAESASDAAALAELAARSGSSLVRATAVAAATFATAATEAAAHLVGVNLAVSAEDPRREHARDLVAFARASRASAVDASG